MDSVEAWLDACDRVALSVEARIRLFLRCREQLAHAHRNLVVHLDLKPSASWQHQGAVKLLDFGTSKLIQPDDSATATLLATPTYASPEQWRKTGHDGLRHLFAGCNTFLSAHRPSRRRAAFDRPCHGARLQGTAASTLSSARIEDAAARSRATTRPRLLRLLRGDIDTIVRAASDPGPLIATLPSMR